MAEQRITPRSEDYAQWYQDVVSQAEIAEPAGVVRGCMVARPHGFAIWEKIQADLDRRFKATDVQNACFPLLIPMSFIQKEKEHIEGFSPELAVVTHAGGKELEEPYVVRPTSETIIGHFFAKWIDSWHDLPLLINQWANVMRWELRTRLFLRTGEFLWQEGHTAHASHEEATARVGQMLDVYRDHCHETLALPVVRGIKTESERFAGAIETRTIESMMQDGKALQSGTSHDLGQNFGKAFNVTFQNKEGEREHVWQTSWGLSWRQVGAVIMTHSDDDGLVVPPKVAPIHVAIVPIFKKEEERTRVVETAEKIAADLRDDGLTVRVDAREDMRPGAKYFEWERKGVPIRLELGPRDLDKEQVMSVTRIAMTDTKKAPLPLGEELGVHVGKLLDQIQAFLLQRAEQRMKDETVLVDTWDEFKEVYAGQKSKFVYAHWDGTAETEAGIKEETKATIRCLPHADDAPERVFEEGACIKTGKPSRQRVLFAKNY